MIKILAVVVLAVLSAPAAHAETKCKGDGHELSIATNDLVDSVTLDGYKYESCDRHSASVMITIECESPKEDKSAQLILTHKGGRITGVSLSYTVGNMSYAGDTDGSSLELSCK